MTEYDRRDVVSTLAAFAAVGVFNIPDKADADGSGRETLRTLLILLVVAQVSLLVLLLPLLVMVQSMKQAKLVPDNRAAGGVPARQRTKRAAKVGTVRQYGDTLFAEMNKNGEAALAKARSVRLSIPINGQNAAVETTLRKASKGKAAALLDQGKLARKSKAVGTLYMDSVGLIMDMKRARLG
ncbi:hypothetical protein [Pseudosulfitobacter sp. DSM 107133]|uniref:hypothetical protein n=1 Tax=Pseudosulfitobacter sp. DSM 107133 TaxID=2883100 RepID=UPI0013B4733C|nr:hypothetical protein [Pseudosulfitobacter sp. DSM 107133]UOA26533.1 hypothetical protein DSM107133_01234 [Pseudosulfitobacter sp. DSM 107133]